MPQVKVTVLVEVDGAAVAGFPMVSRIVADQVVPWNPYFQGANAPGVFVAVPAPTIDVLQALVLRTDAPILVRFAGQASAGLELLPGGLLVALNCNVATGAGTNATVFADSDANVRGLAAGAPQ